MIRLSKSAAARMGLTVPKGGKRGPKKPTPAPMWSAWGIPEPAPEFRFCERRWRIDFCWISEKVAVECEGGLWAHGRHNRPKSMIAEMDKYNRLAVLGFRLLRCTPQQLKSGEIMPAIKEALGIS